MKYRIIDFFQLVATYSSLLEIAKSVRYFNILLKHADFCDSVLVLIFKEY